MTTLYETRGVLAGAYKGKRSNLKATLTHVLAVPEDRVLCGKVKVDSLADTFSGDTEEPATCETCNRRDPRRKS